ncbi:hypothetical protein DPMN_167260 [Dreissena polymorpha]|uniref:Uncharacterized protein n=1 Tax=Dreissena polymorpha TaxID=45954 RepID=A0A9D4F0F3_DREPO|nr:hypothetical protein DPMN_167260 [Dreissena polymorpha]
MDGWRTKTNPETSPEQSAKKCDFLRAFARKTAPTPLGAMAKNVTFRVFTSFYYINIRKMPPGSHVFNGPEPFSNSTLVSKKQNNNVLTKFHENWAKNVTPRVFTCFHYVHLEKTALPPTGSHVFSPIWTIFELIRDINKTNVLTKKTAPPPGSHETNVLTKFVKTALPLGGHVFTLIWTIFELIPDIN